MRYIKCNLKGLILLLSMLSWSSVTLANPSCSDPKYQTYINNRLSTIQMREHDLYKEATKQLGSTPLEQLGYSEKRLYLYSNTVLSAQYDSEDIALRNIKAYENMNSILFLFSGSADRKHEINIARGWLALKAGNDAKAISYLLAAADSKGSPVLKSFGPDTSLIRALYQRGHKEAVLEYLDKSSSFWNTESALQYIKAWKALMANNCALEFGYYDKIIVEKLGL